MESKQIFKTDSPNRWRYFLGSIRLITFISVSLVGVSLLTLTNQDFIQLPRFSGPHKTVRLDSHEFHETKKKLHNIISNPLKIPKLEKVPFRKQLRGAFYVNWDPKSYNSLEKNITKLNIVFPEWIFLDKPGEENSIYGFSTKIDSDALDLMQEKSVPVIPLITNYLDGKWNAKAIEELVNSPKGRQRFVRGIIAFLKQYDFKGVCVDFEEFNEKSINGINQLLTELKEAFKENNFKLFQAVETGNSDFNLKKLGKVVDYLILMAYDQHESASLPGPVAEHKWMEERVSKILKDVKPSKLILGLAAYGYDWNSSKPMGESVTYAESLALASEAKTAVDFNDSSYNLNFNYLDEDNVSHQVWFVDAATSFNALRFSEDEGIAGSAIWRLGSEDSRIWYFYDRDLSKSSLIKNPFDFSLLEHAPLSMEVEVDYQGKGDILEVVEKPKEGLIEIEVDKEELLISEERYKIFPSPYVILRHGQTNIPTVALTFDDGPDAKYTLPILRILKKEKVPATFFVVGEAAELNLPILRKIYDEGFEIGNHTFFHPNLSTVSEERIRLELAATRRLIESVTGHTTYLFRPPYQSDSMPKDQKELYPVSLAKDDFYLTVGESIVPADFEEGITPQEILKRIQEQEKKGSVVLLHDSGGDRSATVAALPEIIKFYKSKGYHFVTIGELIGKKRSEVMPSILGTKQKIIDFLDYIVSGAIYLIENGVISLMILGIILALARTLFILTFSILQRRRELKSGIKLPFEKNKVAIIVPAYNEEKVICRTIDSILNSTYPNFEIIVVNDGSTDRTLDVLKRSFDTNPLIKIIHQKNSGKAAALNTGILNTDASFLVCVDADTILDSQAIGQLMGGFVDPKIGAIAGNVKVGNAQNLLTKLQRLEYFTGQNFDRRAFDYLNAITVIPGAIGAFRRSVMIEAGGFHSDTLAEDCDLTIRILRKGYVITFEPKAIAYTEAPESLKMLIRQRFRWSYGNLQCVWKHRDIVFRPGFGALGWIALPHTLLFNFILPLIAPLADLLLIFAIFGNHQGQLLLMYLVFLVNDAVGAWLALRMEKHSAKDLWLLIPQRFFFRQVMYWVLFKSIISAIRGNTQEWGVIKRTGTVVTT
jgi:peptidoglycan-N-acetylglucosamine deacetylase